MNSIIAKREEYLRKISDLKTQAQTKIDNYKDTLNNEISTKVEAFTKTVTSEIEPEISKYVARISVLDDMIIEEMPNAQPLVDALHAVKIEQSAELASDTTEVIGQKEEEMTKEITLAEEQIESIEEVDEVPENAEVVDCVNVIEAPLTITRPGMAQISIPSRN